MSFFVIFFYFIFPSAHIFASLLWTDTSMQIKTFFNFIIMYFSLPYIISFIKHYRFNAFHKYLFLHFESKSLTQHQHTTFNYTHFGRELNCKRDFWFDWTFEPWLKEELFGFYEGRALIEYLSGKNLQLINLHCHKKSIWILLKFANFLWI